MERKELIRIIYLYLFSLVGLVLIVIGSVRLVDLGLKTFIFTRADQVLIYPVYPRPAPLEGEKDEELTPEEEAKFQEEQRKYEEEQRRSQRERTAANSMAMLIVGVPLFWYHWRLVQKIKTSQETE